MHSVLFQIGGLTVNSYGLMIGIGFLAALALASGRAPKRGLNKDVVFNLALLGIFAGILGARLLYYITDIQAILARPALLWDFSYGYVVYGGVIAGVLAAWLYARKKALPFGEYLDLCVPSIPLAQGFGRIGCFLAGCCYGRPTDAWYGVVFPFSETPLIPTQLLSSAGDFLIALALLLLSKKEVLQGKILYCYMLLYGVGRFLIEFLRADYRGAVGIFSTSQFISLFMVGAGIIGLVMKRRKKS